MPFNILIELLSLYAAGGIFAHYEMMHTTSYIIIYHIKIMHEELLKPWNKGTHPRERERAS